MKQITNFFFESSESDFKGYHLVKKWKRLDKSSTLFFNQINKMCNKMICNATMPTQFEYVYGVGFHLVHYICGKLNHFLWSRVGVHYRADKKCKKCSGKLWFKMQLQADSFLGELIFILLNLISQGDSLITCELDYMLLF